MKENHIKDPAECKELLINSIKEQMDVGETAYRFETEKSASVIGVNGVGKTTSVGKLAGKLTPGGKGRACGSGYLPRSGGRPAAGVKPRRCDMIGGQEGADPAAIVYDAVAAAKARKMRMFCCVIRRDAFIIRRTSWRN